MRSSCHTHKSKDTAVQHSVPHLAGRSWLRKQDQQEKGEELMDTPGVTCGLLIWDPLGQPGTDSTVFPFKGHTHLHMPTYRVPSHINCTLKKPFILKQLINGANDSWCTLGSRRIT